MRSTYKVHSKFLGKFHETETEKVNCDDLECLNCFRDNNCFFSCSTTKALSSQLVKVTLKNLLLLLVLLLLEGHSLFCFLFPVDKM